MLNNYRVVFLPLNRRVQVEEHENILEAAMRAGIHINASCGGNGACGRCRIRVTSGEAVSSLATAPNGRPFADGFTLACQTAVRSDAVIEIPFDSQIDRSGLERLEEGPHLISETQKFENVSGKLPVHRLYVELPQPVISDNMSDVDRLIRELNRCLPQDDIRISLKSIRRLNELIRKSDWKVTVTLARVDGRSQIIDIRPGDTTAGPQYAVAIDIGTTTVCGRLVRLQGGNMSVDIEYADYNGQIRFGEDVISRIMYAGKKGGLKKLHDAVVETMNELISRLLNKGVAVEEGISHIVLSGNTTMMHLLFEIDPRNLMLAPYVPAATCFPPVKAGEIGLKTGGQVYAFTFPCVASYVGGDIVAGVIASDMALHEGIALFMDIGTNGEIVLGNKEWLLCASCSAGPAFEGGGIRFGMRASRGAIERVRIHPTSFEPMIMTVSRQKPVGICGSGLIDLVAGLFEAGLINSKGKFNYDSITGRVRQGNSGYEYVVCFAGETGIGEDIVITEVDLDNLIRTKAAVYAGCKVLMDNAGLKFADLDSVIIAGGFGHYIDVERAQMIGLLPELPGTKFRFLGNASLSGAQLGLIDREILDRAEKTAKMMTNVELSDNSHFTEEFMAAMFLPHTDHRLFPKTMNMIKET